MKDHAKIYVTGNPDDLSPTIASRVGLYSPDLRERWVSATSQYKRTEDGEEVLEIAGLEVMRGFETPAMLAIADIATQHGGHVLNVGFGLGIIDTEIEQRRAERGLRDHYIIELNEGVYRRAVEWRDRQADQEEILLFHGAWQDVLPVLAARGIIFDGVAYDAFPLEAQELHRDVVPFLVAFMQYRLIRSPDGLITFYMDSTDGFGADFLELLDDLGITQRSLERVEVTLPAGGTQYWRAPYFLVPRLTGIRPR